ncbi:hypothetical protein E6C67_08510 [Azospirillum sp. TSA2s]|uniref:hypothetical protein n=1 Tax=Azospirillum sp. TSA2s TaxID=709810 RepID=UPI0010AABBF1|nr:hypothetical protein [Azospirillum sp. TSA2s]QCG93980.1 hypothetical protein E6C67_08510 [Azospirillum sp. TSA2s]
MADEEQEIIDTFYWKTGPCCAGCDWWQRLNSYAGNCTRSAPVSARERTTMLEMFSVSSEMDGVSGHIMTARGHVCGEFKDEFDWSSLPLPYQKRVGALAKR